MSGAFYHCDRCDTKFSYIFTHGWYYDLNGQTMHIAVAPAWCFDCCRLRNAEKLPSIEECERQIEDLSQQRTAKRSRLARPKALEEAMLRLQWRRNRVSDPRCIWCGSTNLQFLDKDPQSGLLPFTHPDCGGTISHTSSYLGSDRPTYFSAEGKLLESTK